MKRRLFVAVFLILCGPVLAHANKISQIGSPIQPFGPSQLITLGMTGTDYYTDSNFVGTITGGPSVTAINGKTTTGAFTAANLTGTIWAGGFGGISGLGLTPSAGFLTAGAGAPQNTNGVYATMTVNTLVFSAGVYSISLAGTTLSNGLTDPDLEPIPVPLDAPDVYFLIPPLEPAELTATPSDGTPISFGASVLPSTSVAIGDAVSLSDAPGAGYLNVQTGTITGPNAGLFEIVGGFSPTTLFPRSSPASVDYDLRFLARRPRAHIQQHLLSCSIFGCRLATH